MFGKPITNIKSYKLFESVVCKEYDHNDCWPQYKYCKPGENFDKDNKYCKSVSDTQSKTFEMKNIKTIDIAEYDSQLFFTTTETADSDRILHGIYTDNLLNEISAWIAADVDALNGEKIRGVKLGVEAVGRFIITESGNLYGFGKQRYGILGNGIIDEEWNYTKILMDENRPDLQVQDLCLS